MLILKYLYPHQIKYSLFDKAILSANVSVELNFPFFKAPTIIVTIL